MTPAPFDPPDAGRAIDSPEPPLSRPGAWAGLWRRMGAVSVLDGKSRG